MPFLGFRALGFLGERAGRICFLGSLPCEYAGWGGGCEGGLGWLGGCVGWAGYFVNPFVLLLGALLCSLGRVSVRSSIKADGIAVLGAGSGAKS